MQSIIGPALIALSVLAVAGLRPKASGTVPRFMLHPAVDEAVAIVVTIIAAFGILVTVAMFTPLF